MMIKLNNLYINNFQIIKYFMKIKYETNIIFSYTYAIRIFLFYLYHIYLFYILYILMKKNIVFF